MQIKCTQGDAKGYQNIKNGRVVFMLYGGGKSFSLMLIVMFVQ